MAQCEKEIAEIHSRIQSVHTRIEKMRKEHQMIRTMLPVRLITAMASIWLA